MIGLAVGPLCSLAVILFIYSKEGTKKKAALSVFGWPPIDQGPFCNTSEGSAATNWHGTKKLCRTQLQNWNSNNCSKERDTGLTKKSIKSLGECGVPQNTMEQLSTVAATLAG